VLLLFLLFILLILFLSLNSFFIFKFNFEIKGLLANIFSKDILDKLPIDWLGVLELKPPYKKDLFDI
jgi:hypothetical protein